MANRTGLNPKAVGEISEAMVLARLVELGYAVALPFGNNQRYDVIIDDHGELIRAQVKTGRLACGSISFPLRSTNGFTGEQRGYLGEADIFLVYCPETTEVYRIPVAACGDARKGYLRVAEDHFRVGRSNVRWAQACLLRGADEGPDGVPELRTCVVVHPGTPPRLRLKSGGSGKVRRYCLECNRVWERRRRERLRAPAG